MENIILEKAGDQNIDRIEPKLIELSELQLAVVGGGIAEVVGG
jgi:hypothetical protein